MAEIHWEYMDWDSFSFSYWEVFTAEKLTFFVLYIDILPNYLIPHALIKSLWSLSRDHI